MPGFYLVFTGEGAAVAGPGDLPGYPQLTGQAERKIFGENLLRLHGMDAPVMGPIWPVAPAESRHQP